MRGFPFILVVLLREPGGVERVRTDLHCQHNGKSLSVEHWGGGNRPAREGRVHETRRQLQGKLSLEVTETHFPRTRRVSMPLSLRQYPARPKPQQGNRDVA